MLHGSIENHDAQSPSCGGHVAIKNSPAFISWGWFSYMIYPSQVDSPQSPRGYLSGFLILVTLFPMFPIHTLTSVPPLQLELRSPLAKTLSSHLSYRLSLPLSRDSGPLQFLFHSGRDCPQGVNITVSQYNASLAVHSSLHSFNKARHREV
jgi:hypothetical protein